MRSYPQSRPRSLSAKLLIPLQSHKVLQSTHNLYINIRHHGYYVSFSKAKSVLYTFVLSASEKPVNLNLFYMDSRTEETLSAVNKTYELHFLVQPSQPNLLLFLSNMENICLPINFPYSGRNTNLFPPPKRSPMKQQHSNVDSLYC